MAKVFLPEMTSADGEDVIEHVGVALLQIGSNEGHGPHLPLKVDGATRLLWHARRRQPCILGCWFH